MSVRSDGVFVVGTGRCGSTLLGDLLGLLPGVAVLHEALTWLEPPFLFPMSLTPDEFADGFIAAPMEMSAVWLTNRLEPVELRYPIDDPGSRFDRSTGLPPLSGVCLPGLGDPDWLHDVGEAYLRSLGNRRRPVPEMLAGLFDHLTEAVGCTQWFERSGASLNFVGNILAGFPGARIVHIHRRGPDVAASMSRSPMFRFHLARMKILKHTGTDPYLPGGDVALRPEQLPAECRWALPDAFDAAGFHAWQPPIFEFARLWAYQMRFGLRRLARAQETHVHHLRYEDLVAEPARTLASLATFLEVPAADAADWVDRCCPEVRRPDAPAHPTTDRVVSRLVDAVDHELVRVGAA